MFFLELLELVRGIRIFFVYLFNYWLSIVLEIVVSNYMEEVEGINFFGRVWINGDNEVYFFWFLVDICI